MSEIIRRQRMAAFAELMHSQGVDHTLVLNPGLGNLDHLLSREGLYNN